MVKRRPGTLPALYECVTTHVRRRPRRIVFRHRMYLWLVDLDDLPRLPWPLRPLARFDPRDHLGNPALSVRENLRFWLNDAGLHPDGRFVMLAHARVFGHVFNPLTVYWCHHSDGTLACVVAEVHNTYGGRHRYLLDPSAGRTEACVDKTFHVSPFFPVRGNYRMRLPEPDARLALTVHLEVDGARPFTATLNGIRRAATARGLLRAALRHPLVTLAVSARIRVRGIGLWLRGLPRQARPTTTRCPAVDDPAHTAHRRGNTPGELRHVPNPSQSGKP